MFLLTRRFVIHPSIVSRPPINHFGAPWTKPIIVWIQIEFNCLIVGSCCFLCCVLYFSEEFYRFFMLCIYSSWGDIIWSVKLDESKTSFSTINWMILTDCFVGKRWKKLWRYLVFIINFYVNQGSPSETSCSPKLEMDILETKILKQKQPGKYRHIHLYRKSVLFTISFSL